MQTDYSRRRFLNTAAMAMAAAGLGGACMGGVAEGASRQLEAVGAAPGWLNSPALSAAALAGRVVLLDFCTFTCINWLRTLPHIRAWAGRYRRELVVIGVHTPEFEIERNVANVKAAMAHLNVVHPIAIDTSYDIWRAFDNHYWPARYLIDHRGRIVHSHFGEGEYDKTEMAIQRALTGAGVPFADGRTTVNPSGVELQADWSNLRSGENYLGYTRTQNFASPGGRSRQQPHSYEFPRKLSLNEWALSGNWSMDDEFVRLHSVGGRLRCRFHARDLHLVLGISESHRPVPFRVSLDGQPPNAAHGLDTDASGAGVLKSSRLYQMIRQQTPVVDREFEVEFLDVGVEALAFTFG